MQQIFFVNLRLRSSYLGKCLDLRQQFYKSNQQKQGINKKENKTEPCACLTDLTSNYHKFFFQKEKQNFLLSSYFNPGGGKALITRFLSFFGLS